MSDGLKLAEQQNAPAVSRQQVHVRFACATDATCLQRLTRELAAEHGEEGEACTAHALSIALWSPQPLLHALVAEVRGKIVGSVMYSVGFSTFMARPRIWIEDMIVSHDYRRLGVAAALMAVLRAEATILGAIEMQGLVSDNNPRALAFWRNEQAAAKSGWSMINIAVKQSGQ